MITRKPQHCNVTVTPSRTFRSCRWFRAGGVVTPQLAGWVNRVRRNTIAPALKFLRSKCKRCRRKHTHGNTSGDKGGRDDAAARRAKKSSVPLTEFMDAYEQYCGTRGYTPKSLDESAELMQKGFGVTIETREAKGYSGVRWRDIEHERPTHGAAPTPSHATQSPRFTCACAPGRREPGQLRWQRYQVLP